MKTYCENPTSSVRARIELLVVAVFVTIGLATGVLPDRAYAAHGQDPSADAASTYSQATLQAQAAAEPQADGALTIDEVRALIESLPSVTAVTEEDGDLIRRTRSAYDALTPEERTLLDTETNRAALGVTQSYGRVLELAEAGLAVLYPIDNSTELMDGIYTTSVTSTWNRGKSASKQDREWSAVRVRVEGKKAFVTMCINSSTYSFVRASGQVARRLESSSAGESLFTFPVSLGSQMVFTGYSQTMATEIAYNLRVSVAAGASPDADLSTDPDGGSQADTPSTDSDKPLVTVDETTGNVIVERGSFAHPEIKGYMFRIVDPSIIVSDGSSMSVYAEMPSTSYTHLFVGTAEEAEQKSLEDGVADGSFIPAKLVANAQGTTVASFTFPLASLDRDIPICLFSEKNQHWVDQAPRFDSASLTWYQTAEDEEALRHVIDLLENLPARNTIVPDNAEHEAVVRAARDAYESLNRWQKDQIPARLMLLLEWDESMFDLGFNTEYLPMAIAGQAYDGAVYVSGKNGETGKSIAVCAGSLPEGLHIEMDEAGLWARFVGTPEENGTWSFTLSLTNDLGEQVSKEFTLHVGFAPTIKTQTLPDARAGVPYYQGVIAEAYPDATWSLVEGELPQGLTFHDDGDEASTAHISGTPSVAGTFSFTLACNNFANGEERKQYTLHVLSEDDPASSDDAEEIARLRAQLAAANAQLASANEQLASTEQQLDTANTQLEDSKQQLSATQLDLSSANEQLSIAEQGRSTAEANLANTEKKLSETNAQLASAKTKLSTTEKKLSTANTELSTTKKELATAEKKLSTTSTKLSATEKKLSKATKDNASLKKSVSKLNSQVKTLKAKLPAPVVISAKTVTASSVQSALKKARNPYATTVTIGANVKAIKDSAFKGTDVRTLVLKTNALTKNGVKGSLKSSKVTTVQVKVASADLAKTKRAYRAYFTKTNVGRSVTVK